MDWKNKERHDTLRSWTEELAGDVQSPETLGRHTVDLSTELGDHGVAMAINRATGGKRKNGGIKNRLNQD